MAPKPIARGAKPKASTSVTTLFGSGKVLGDIGYLNIAKVLGVKGMAFTEHIRELSRTSVEACLHLMISSSLDVAWDRSREPGHLQTQVWA